MSRWLFIALCLACVAAFSAVPRARSTNARSLGGLCESARDCQEGLECTDVEGVMAGQCTTACNSTAACQQHHGGESLCLGADVCARTCADRTDCPEGNVCNAYGWCEAARAE